MSLIAIETLASSRKEHPWGVWTIWLLPLEFGFIKAELSWKVPCVEVMVGFQKLEVLCARGKIVCLDGTKYFHQCLRTSIRKLIHGLYFELFTPFCSYFGAS